ncbi:DUF1232 domain-containing protein [Patescibacteria group bacterium]|nr:MAG: DUF1232 domain-containing protein [Patescibacteria group bacterium]
MDGMSRVRFMPDWRAVAAYLRDPSSDWKPKVFAVLAIAYLIWPADLVPDIVPLLGWFDDIGLAGVATWYLMHAAGRKRPPAAP